MLLPAASALSDLPSLEQRLLMTDLRGAVNITTSRCLPPLAALILNVLPRHSRYDRQAMRVAVVVAVNATAPAISVTCDILSSPQTAYD